MDSSHTREDTNAPSYDSSDEWEIGLGNLIIDLDADLEKDGHHDGAPAHLEASPMKVGKMKIKRKVSSSATKGEGVSPITVRKDSNASTGSSSTMDDASSAYASPDRSGWAEDQIGKPTKSVAAPSNQSGSSNISGPKLEVNPSLKLDKLVPNLAIKPMTPMTTMTTMTTMSNALQLKTSSTNLLNPSPATATTATPPQNAPPARPSSLHLLGEGGKQQKTPKSPGEEGEGEEAASIASKKIKMEKDCKVDGAAGKRSGEASCSGRKHGGKKAKVDKPLRHSVAVDTMDIGVATEPESIGPCEPGTSVNLEGIVWHETDQGVLVVNVTWRNKTYVGTLMDCTRHDWAAPRFCDSPTSDMESRGKGGGRPKRGRNNNSSSSDLSNYTETRSSIHSKLRNSTKGRRGSNASNGARTPPCTLDKNTSKRKTKEPDVEEPVPTNKRQKTSVRPNSSANEDRHTPVLIECPQPNCNKKYKHKNGLHYHLSHAHHNNLDKDGNWRERTDYDDDSKSSASDDVGLPLVQTKDKKKDLKDKKESSKEEEEEEERMDVDKGETKASETPEEESAPSLQQGGSSEGSVDSGGEATGQKKSESSKSKDGTKSPKTHKSHVDKFTAGMKCLGIPKPKEAKSSPSKVPKNDASGDRLSKSVKKPPAASSDKDMSIFDFNSAPDEQVTANAMPGSTPEKHVSVSVIRPNPEPMTVKSEPVSPSSVAKAAAADHAKGPKQHLSTNSDNGSEDKNSKKTDKDKFRADKHKKAKHDKMLVKTGKTIRPIAPAPAPPTTQAPPPQLIAIPTALVQNPVTVSCALSVPAVNTIQTKPQASLVSPALKPIQPKPATMSSVPSNDVSGSLLAMKDKDKKSKQKKKVKVDKEREKEKLPGSPVDSSKAAKEHLGEQRIKNNPLLLAVPETNILKQALTASGIVEPDNSEKNKAVAPDMWKRDGSKSDAPMDRVTKVLPSPQDKPASTAPVSNVTMPQIPKLIPTSSVTVPSSRPSKQIPLPSQHPQHLMQPSHLQTPSQLQQPHPHQPPMSLAAGIKLPVSKPDTVSQDRASSNLSVHTSLAKEGPRNNQLLSPPSGNRTGNISPAYSDISEDGVDDQSKQTKPSETFSFERPDHLKPHSESSQRISESNLGGERRPLFHGSDRTGAPDGAGSGSITQGKPPHERDEGRKGDGKDQSTPRSASINPTLPPPVPHVYSGSHYPYLHGYVNIDPSYHMRLMASDPKYRQQQERLMEDQRKRVEKLRGQEGSEKPGENKVGSSEKRRPVINIQTEPITPPQAPRHLDSRDKSRDKEHITKSRHIEFSKKEGSSPSTARTPESDKQNSAMLLEKRQREDMRQYYLYQQKLMEQPQHRQAEEPRKNVEQENRKKEGVELSKKDLSTPEQAEKSRTPTPTHRNVSTPTKETSGRLSADPDKRDSKSPSGKGSKPDGKKLIDGYPYLQPPYPYGTIPYDPSHPTFQPMVYPSFLHPDLRYPAAGAGVTPAWKSPSDKAGFEQEPERCSSSPHSLSSKGRKSPDTPDLPARALDVLQQHANQYFSPHQKHGSNSRPRTPEKGRTTPVQRSRSSSPAARKTPETSTSSSISSSREDGKRGTVHQHMHTHQHTHVGVPVGVTYPVLPPYDPYVMASQQAAAAASAAAVNQYSRREKS